MATITTTELQDLATLTRQLTELSFLEALEAALATWCDFDTIVVVIYRPKQRPILLHPQDPAEQSSTLRFYLAHAYVLDPIFNAIETGTRQGVYRLAQLAPDQFEQTEYYQTCYRDFGLVEETNLLIPLSATDTCAISLGRTQISGPIRQRELNLLKRFFVMLEALVQQFWQLQGQKWTGERTQEDNLEAMGQALDSFAADRLTEREREIVGLLLRGFSSKAIANDLGISAETVKVHRKNIHTRLGTSSQADIFNLFLQHLQHK